MYWFQSVLAGTLDSLDLKVYVSSPDKEISIHYFFENSLSLTVFLLFWGLGDMNIIFLSMHMFI